MEPVQFKPTFVKTKNVRNFEVMMDGLALGAGEGRLGLVYGQAGRGKSRTSQWYAAICNCVYLHIAAIWRQNETEFLQALCRELEILEPPKRKGACYTAILDVLSENPRTVFLDELEKMPGTYLDLVRDISDGSSAAFVLVGEEGLPGYMRRNRCVWTRTFQQLAFTPISISEIMVYAKETTGIPLTAQHAKMFHTASKGCLRLVKRTLLELIQIVNAKQSPDITDEMVKIALKAGLKGR